MPNFLNEEWKDVLKKANERIKKNKYRIKVEKDDEDYYFISIKHPNGEVEEFESNDFESEVVDGIYAAESLIDGLIRGAASKKEVWVLTHTETSMDDYNSNGAVMVDVFDSEKKAKAELKKQRREEKKFAKDFGRDYEILEDHATEFRMSWCMHSNQLRIEIHKAEIK